MTVTLSGTDRSTAQYSHAQRLFRACFHQRGKHRANYMHVRRCLPAKPGLS